MSKKLNKLSLKGFIKLIVLDDITDAEIDRQFRAIDNRLHIIHSPEPEMEGTKKLKKYKRPLINNGKGKFKKDWER